MGILNIFGNSDKNNSIEEKKVDDNYGNMVDSDIHLAAKDMLTEILDLMGFFNVVKVVKYEENFVSLDIKGDDMGRIIGKEGSTLQSLQILLRSILSKKFKMPINVVLDASGYRDKREDTLKAHAKEMAEQAIENKQEVVLRPMNSWERRIVHMTLQDNKAVKTESIGQSQDRKVVITPA